MLIYKISYHFLDLQHNCWIQVRLAWLHWARLSCKCKSFREQSFYKLQL